MLQVYLASVVIWVLIMFATVVVLADKIAANGWLALSEYNGQRTNGLVVFLLTCAIPFWRLLVCSVLFLMASMTVEEWTKKQNEDDEEDE